MPASLLFAGGLADNGGPTQTIALRDAADNPALGGADPADAPATDQRGVARPQPAGTNPDIGAFELNQTGTVPNEIVGTGARRLSSRGTRRRRRDPRPRRQTIGCGAAPATTCCSAAAGCDVLAGDEGIDR